MIDTFGRGTLTARSGWRIKIFFFYLKKKLVKFLFQCCFFWLSQRDFSKKVLNSLYLLLLDRHMKKIYTTDWLSVQICSSVETIWKLLNNFSPRDSGELIPWNQNESQYYIILYTWKPLIVGLNFSIDAAVFTLLLTKMCKIILAKRVPNLSAMWQYLSARAHIEFCFDKWAASAVHTTAPPGVVCNVSAPRK